MIETVRVRRRARRIFPFLEKPRLKLRIRRRAQRVFATWIRPTGGWIDLHEDLPASTADAGIMDVLISHARRRADRLEEVAP
jgi:hypothetical protein